MLIARDDLLAQAGLKGCHPRPGSTCSRTPRRPSSPRGAIGLGIPVSNQTDSNVWEDVMKSHGARLADEAGKRVVLGDHKREVWEFLDYFTEVWKANVFPPGVTTWDNTMNNSTFQSGKAVFVLNPVTLSLWLEAEQPRGLLAKTGHYTYPRGPKSLIHPVNFGSRSVLKCTKVPELAKQFRVGARWSPPRWTRS